MISTAKILKLLQANARMSLKTIAENTFLSSPAVSARIERLEKEGIITGYHAMVDPMKLGYHILAFINLDVVPEDKPKFYAYAKEVPNVLECSCVTGDFSMLMKVAFQSTMELDMFIGQLQKFGKTSTQIVFPPMWVPGEWMWTKFSVNICLTFTYGIV